jgi:hypothetical protein
MRLTESLAGAILGALGLSLLTYAFHWFFFNSTVTDGQYFFVFMVTFPVGALLGGLTGFVAASATAGHGLTAGRMALFSGAVLFAIFLWLGWTVFCGTNPSLQERLWSTAFWFTLPLLWSALLVRGGLRILSGR